MTTSTLLPGLVEGFSKPLAAALDDAHSEWPPESAEALIAGVRLVRQYVEKIDAAARAFLATGGDARDFVRRFEEWLPPLDRSLAYYERLEKQGTVASAPTEVRAAVAAVWKAMTACRDFLAEALAKAKAAPPALDWDRLKRDSDADFAAGRFRRYDDADALRRDLTGGA